MPLLEDLRQLLYPKEFRIADPKWPELSGVIADVLTAFQSQPLAEHPPPDDRLLGLIVDVGTVVWRLQRRSAAEVQPAENLRRISRDLESAWYAFREAGIEIKDHTGEIYDGGMALRVLAFQPTAGLSRDQVIETIKPTIYHKDRILRVGEVIVGTPVK